MDHYAKMGYVLLQKQLSVVLGMSTYVTVSLNGFCFFNFSTVRKPITQACFRPCQRSTM